jgi:hypothetical protein
LTYEKKEKRKKTKQNKMLVNMEVKDVKQNQKDNKKKCTAHWVIKKGRYYSCLIPHC